MGPLRNTFSFFIGTCCGMYIEPKYKKFMRSLTGKEKEVEESYKNPGNVENKD